MAWIPDRYRALRSLVHGELPGRDAAEEMAHHVALRTADNIAAGMAPAAAREDALRRMGDVAGYCREVVAIDVGRLRRQRRAAALGGVAHDFRRAVRALTQHRATTLLAVATLALGIGANTAIFSVVDAVLLHPLAAPALGRLVVLQDDLPGLGLHRTQISPGEALDLFARHDLFAASAAFFSRNDNLGDAGRAQRVDRVLTLGQFFGVLGARPYIGRLYRAADSRNGNTAVVVLSYAFWQALTGGDPHAVGRTITLDDAAYRIIGVLPPGIGYPRSAQLWTPAPIVPRMLTPDQRGTLYLTALARRRRDVSMPRLRGQLAAEVRRWKAEFGSAGYDPSWGEMVVATPFRRYAAGQLRPISLVLLAAVGFVLLIACANVACLQLVRGVARSREFAVRMALGAGRWALVRQLLVESVVLAAVGGLAGVAVGEVLIRLIARTQLAQAALVRGARLDPLVLGYTAAVTLVAGLLFGILPVLRVARTDPGDGLRDSTARGASMGRGARRLLETAAALELALTLVLLLGSGLVFRSLDRLLQSDPGFRAAHVVTMGLSVSGARYATPASRLAFHDALLHRLSRLPGVQSAGTAFGLPFTTLGTSSPFAVIGRAATDRAHEPHAAMWYVGGHYFRTLGIRLIAGRTFDAADQSGAQPVSIIDAALAKRFFGTRNPVGQRIRQGPTTTIVGVVGSVEKRALGASPKPAVYYPYPQVPWAIGSMTVAVRTTLPASSAAPLLRRAVHQLDPSLAVFGIMSMQARVDRSLGARRLAMHVLIGFAALALILALLGTYGVLSNAVSHRRHEIGIRLALGAAPGDVVRLVVRQAMTLAATGLAAGLGAFWILGRGLRALLYGVALHDPITLAAGTLVLTGAALLASWLPARRAARVDPMDALGSD